MSDRFMPLDCDDDVILLDRDTFKVSRLKELSLDEIRKNLYFQIYDSNNNKPGNYLYNFFSAISVQGKSIQFNEIQFASIKDCQLLKIDGKGWQKGKLRIEIYWLVPRNQKKIEINLEFCSDEPIASESPLDDLHKIVQTEN